MSQTVENIENYDVRVVQRYLREGRIRREDYEAWLASLPDESALCTETETRFTASETEGEDR